jgi:hypothetical protein
MDVQVKSETPALVRQSRWWRSRKLQAMLFLLGGGVLLIWFLPRLLMPEDLRRMQGEWRLSRAQGERHVEGAIAFETWTIGGDRLQLAGGPPMGFRIDAATRTFYIFAVNDTEWNLLGIKVQVPWWLLRHSNYTFGQYELEDGRLTLLFQGEGDAKNPPAKADPNRLWKFSLDLERD